MKSRLLTSGAEEEPERGEPERAPWRGANDASAEKGKPQGLEEGHTDSVE